jgi:hypothetical protein
MVANHLASVGMASAGLVPRGFSDKIGEACFHDWKCRLFRATGKQYARRPGIGNKYFGKFSASLNA